MHISPKNQTGLSSYISTRQSPNTHKKLQHSEEDQQKLKKLKMRDQEVRRHEQAHISAGGNLVQGGAKYSFETGPDGQQYAVEGSVHIDTSKVAGNPKATLEKARKIRRAALAPADPSGQDRLVAAEADRMELEAQKQISEEQNNGDKGFYGSDGRAQTASSKKSTFFFFA